MSYSSRKKNTIYGGYMKSNFGASFYSSKTEKELKLGHKIKTNFFEETLLSSLRINQIVKPYKKDKT